MTKISQDEAILILKKMSEDKVRVVCNGTCWGWQFWLIGSITEATDDGLVFKSTDGKCVLGLNLKLENTYFVYGEPRDLPRELLENVPEVDRMRGMVAIGLPLRVIPYTEDKYNDENLPWREKLWFIELPPESVAYRRGPLRERRRFSESLPHIVNGG